MDWKLEAVDGAHVAAPAGDIDHTSADAFKENLLPALETAAGGKLVLDMSGVAYMSSVGLRVIMIAVKEAKAKGVTLVVAGLNETLAEIFQIARFDKIMSVFPDVAAAIAAD